MGFPRKEGSHYHVKVLFLEARLSDRFPGGVEAKNALSVRYDQPLSLRGRFEYRAV